MKRPSKSRLAEEMRDSCLHMRVRYIARVMTALYDDALRPLGIKASQLNLLGALAQAGPARRSEIGKFLHLDSSTLTRNLRIMETNGWIEEVAAGADGRGHPIRLTAQGRALLERAAPAWRSAQLRAARLIGDDGASALTGLADGLLKAAS